MSPQVDMQRYGYEKSGFSTASSLGCQPYLVIPVGLDPNIKSVVLYLLS